MEIFTYYFFILTVVYIVYYTVVIVYILLKPRIDGLHADVSDDYNNAFGFKTKYVMENPAMDGTFYISDVSLTEYPMQHKDSAIKPFDDSNVSNSDYSDTLRERINRCNIESDILDNIDAFQDSVAETFLLEMYDPSKKRNKRVKIKRNPMI